MNITPNRYSGSPGRPSWSPDGSKVGVVLNREALIVDPKTETVLAEIGPDADNVGSPQFSPQSDQIAYDIWNSDEKRWMIQVGKPDGSEAKTIVPHGRNPRWSPDGTQIAYSSYTDDHQTKVSLVNPDGSNDRVLSRQPQSQEYVWSPDGKSIAYDAIGETHYELRVHDLETGQERILGDGDNHAYIDRTPAWSPSSKTIAFERRHRQYPAASLWTVDVESGQTKQLFQKLADVVDPVFSPDGKTLIFGSNHDRRPGLDLFSMELSTLKMTQLTDLPGDEHSPSFSPDGKTLAFLNTDSRRPSDQRTELHFLTPDVGSVTK